MKSRNFALLLLSLFGLITLPKAQALPPAAPTDGSVRFTRLSLTKQEETYHSYHLRWKDNDPNADGTELQLRFANAGDFYFLTNDQRGLLNPFILDISERDSNGFREAIISVGSPPAGTLCQFRVVVWKFNGAKTESSSLLIQTRVPARPKATTPPSNVTFLAPANLTTKFQDGKDGPVEISWEDKSEIEGYQELFLGEVSGNNPITYKQVGFIPFAHTKIDLHKDVYMPFNIEPVLANSDQIKPLVLPRPSLVPGKSYRVALRATKSRYVIDENSKPIRYSPLPSLSLPAPGNAPAIPADPDNATETQGIESITFTMPALKAPTNLKEPTDLLGSASDESTIQLQWDDNSNNETGYEIQYRPITGGVPPDFAPLAEAPANATLARVSVGQLATAEFRVCAIHKYKPATGDEIVIRSAFAPETVQLSTTQFLPPSNLTAVTSGTDKTIDLSWEDNATAEVGFDVFCRPSGSSGAYNRCLSVPENVTKASVKSFTASNDASGIPIFTDLILGTNYDFIVRAVGAQESASSADSNVATAATQQGFTSKMYGSILYGTSSSYSVTTSIPATSITATGLPAGMQIASSTGLISGTATQIGRFPITLTAAFSSAPSISGTLMLLVAAPDGNPITLNTIPSATIRINEPLVISLDDKFVDLDTERAARWETTQGNIDFLLSPRLAPQAVENFMAYVNGGDYTNVIFHRHVANFVLQAGGYRARTPEKDKIETALALESGSIIDVNKRSSPENEPGLSNLEWTIAAAKQGARNSIATLTNSTLVKRDETFGYYGNPNSATTDIFINLGDNSSNLDNQNGGFTVFGRVSIPTQPTVTAIRQLPVGDYSTGTFETIFGDLFKQLPVSLTPAPAVPKHKELVRILRAGEIAPLTFSLDSLSANVASVTVENNQLLIYGITQGTRTVTVTAKDLDNKTVTQTFTITVNDSYLPPAITAQPVSQVLASGTPASLRVTATGSSLSYIWRKNGVEISPPETNAILNFTSFGQADVGDYDVVVYNNTSTVLSRKASLSLQAPTTITGTLPAKLVEVGKPLEIEANITGSPAPVCVWRRGTTVIPAQTSRKLSIPSAKLSDAGSYTVTASNAGGSSTPGAGGSATVVVIDKTTQYQNVKIGTQVKLTAPVAGQGLTYQWKKGGVDIENTETGFSGQQDATLIISSATTANIGDYSCTIEAPAGLGSAETGVISIRVPTDKPSLAPFLLPNAFVGLEYNHTVALLAGSSQTGAPGRFIVTGLPAGLTCDVNTGIISGTPRAIGNFNVRLTVSNVIGSAAPVTSILRVSPLLGATAGSYVARVTPSQAINLNLGGRLNLTLTDNSAFTATLQLAGETFRAGGVMTLLSVNNSLTYGSVISFPRPNRRAIEARLLIRASSTVLDGSINDGTSFASLRGYRSAWTAQFRSGPAPFNSIPFAFAVDRFKFSVLFNVALDPETTRLQQIDTPEGSGFLALKVTNDGTATMSGRLADGTTVTASSLTSGASEMYLFQMLNSNTASLGGFLNLNTPISNDNLEPSGILGGDLRWIKGRQPLKEKSYQPGFSPTILSAHGSRYIVEKNISALRVSDIERNAKITFTRAGIPSIDPNLSLKISPTDRVTFPSPNLSKVSLTINPTTGLISGSFELYDTEKRRATYQGLIIPSRNKLISTNPLELKLLPPTALGHFLLPGLTPSVATSAIRSGLVSMNGIFITSQPSSQNVAKGSNVTLSVEALVIADLTALTYEWQKNGVTLTDGAGVSGATTATISLAAIDEADIAEYKCLIKSGTEVQAISNGAKLGINISDVVLSRTAPAPTMQNPHVALSTQVTLSVTSMGPAPTYQWYKNNVLISGAKAATYSFDSGLTANTTNYTVRVANSFIPGGVLSNVLPVTVIDGVRDVVISRTAPTTSSVAISSPFTLSVSAYGEALTYQWKDSSGADIAGETGPTFSGTSGNTAGSQSYSVVVKNPLTPAGITSSTFTVNVVVPISGISITKTDPNVPVGLNTTVTLNVTALGTDPTFQWLRGTTVIPGATGASYTFTSATAAGTTNYFVRVNNGATTAAGILSSAFPVTTVSPLSNVQIRRTAPTTASVATGAPVTLTASATGSSLSYLWYKDNVLIPNETNPTYTFTEPTVGSPKFKVKVSNPLLTAGLESSELTVNVITPISGVSAARTTPSSGATVPLNTSVTLTVTANGTSPTYQWYRGTTLIAGATSATYTFNSGTRASTTSYNVRVTNPAMAAATTSNSVSVQVAP
jgi:cyclophilin family peptidyl-prolyl cis-trans isomerase